MKKIFFAIVMLVLLAGSAYGELKYVVDQEPAPSEPDNYEIVTRTPALASVWNDRFYHLDLRLNTVEGLSGTGLQNIVEDLTPQLGADLDTNSFDINISSGFHLLFGANQIDDGSDKLDGEQIADNTIDEDSPDWGSGAGQIDADDVPESVTLRFVHVDSSFPGGPSAGDPFYHTTHNTSFQYEDSMWNPIINYGTPALDLYVDTGAGTDGIGYGYASGSDAYATVQGAWDDLIPAIFNGIVTMYISADTYAEAVILAGKAPGSSTASITIIGTLTNIDTGNADADSTVFLIEDDGQGWTPSEHAGKLVRMTSGATDGQERFIVDNDADTLTLAYRLKVEPDGDDFSIDTLGTIVNPGGGNVGFDLSAQHNVTIKYVEVTGGAYGVLAQRGCHNLIVQSCDFDTQTTNGIFLHSSTGTLQTIYIHASTNTGLFLQGASFNISDAYIEGNNTDGLSSHAGIILTRGAYALLYRNYIDANDDNGLWAQQNAVYVMLGAGNNNYITNHDTAGDIGIKTTTGAQGSGIGGQSFNNNDTNENDDATTFGYHS